MIKVAEAGDPTADPSQEWPQNRRAVDVGTLIVQDIEPEANGPCRDINYDPTVLPTGMRNVGRSVPGGALIRLPQILRSAHGRSR